MPKKEMTPEEKKAFGAKMKAAREAKKIATPSPASDEVKNPDITELLRQVQELKARLDEKPLQQEAPQVNNRGKLIGTFEKYTVDPDYYPNPAARLSQEPRLSRFAFPINYELDYNVMTTSYETIDGIRTKEPRFNLTLSRVVMDEDTGEPTNQRYIVRRLSFHEDPDAAIEIAREQGIKVESTNERDFLNEMRYLRMRDWLLEVFYPPKSTAVKNKKDVVVGNQLVEMYEISSEKAEPIPFNELRN